MKINETKVTAAIETTAVPMSCDRATFKNSHSLKTPEEKQQKATKEFVSSGME
jgi:hypothetical protein